MKFPDNLGSQPTFIFSILDTATPISVLSFSAHEWMSHYFTVKLTVLTAVAIEPFPGAIGQEAVLTIIDNEVDAVDTDRHFHGIIGELEHVGICEGRHIYELELVPSLWRLTLRRNCRIFQELDVQEIVGRILEEGGITSDRYRFALLNEKRRRGFCVQYRESDFDFVSRLLEEEGIFYFFEHSEDKHVLVMSDYNFFHSPIGGESCIPFNAGGMAGDSDCIRAFSFSQRLRPGAFTHRNFNFKRPSFDLTSKVADTDQDDPEVYDYPALHTTPERGGELAKVRLEELVAMQSQGHGQTSCCRLVPGYTFTLTGHEAQCLNGEYLIVSVMHAGLQPQSLEELSGGGFSYDCEFTVIPASVQFRPTVTAHKPSIPGLQTAMVVGPPGEEIHTDEYGRIKVRFHWDREPDNCGRSSCWLRINQPWSGGNWGMLAIPRVGDEVLVAFLEGDPDRPVMVGSVNNAQSPALYELPAHQTRTGIRTQSTPNGSRENYNELRFEDKKGSEHIYLQGERDWNILIKNDKEQLVGNNESLLVRNDRKKTVERNQSESVGMNNSILVGADHQEQIGANLSRSVGVSKSEMVGGDAVQSVGLTKTLTVGGLYQVSVGGALNETVAGAKSEEVGLAKAVLVGADLTERVTGNRELKVGGTLEIQAGDSLQIVCGQSVLRMESDGSVFLNGARIELSSSGIMKATAQDLLLN